MAEKETLAAWLKDAYAMEQGIVPVLDNHAKDARDHPEVHQRIARHKEETRRHAEIVKECLKELGEDTSSLKTGMAKMQGMVQAVSTGMAQDELVKNNLADYATEHFEIACYKALCKAADAAGQPGIRQKCEQILREEEEMAHFLEMHLPQTVEEFMMQKSGS
jgi:ferritin-like metal-binding protein YciE